MVLKYKPSIKSIKRILINKGYIIYKKHTSSINKSFKSFYFTFLISFLLISLFFALPRTVLITAELFKVPKEIQNNSKVDFERKLSGKKETNIIEKLNDEVSAKDLFADVDVKEDSQQIPTDFVRFTGPTLYEFYKLEGYTLEKVRKTKLVNPGFGRPVLPIEIDKIEGSKKRKELFIKIVLPIILQENKIIKLDRKRLFVILNKNNNTKSEKRWLDKKFKQYGVAGRDLVTLKIRMDEIPVSMAIAQAAKETGWGTSRFALEGNALFGQWTWSGEGIKPAGADSDATHKVMKFKILQASVKAYQRNLNTHSSYIEFRKARAIQRDNMGKLNSLKLVKFLDKYAATGKEYTIILKKIIEQNSLTDFDNIKLLPTSEKIKKLI